MTVADSQFIPLADLKAQFASIEGEIRAAIDRVLKSQVFIMGPEVIAAERDIAAYCGSKHGIGVSSGTDALLVALMALDIGPGDEVVTTASSFFATAGAIARTGATPVFVDIEPGTSNLDPAGVARAITPRTKAIIPVHLFGQCADMAPIMEVAKKHGIAVIEDAAQAIGAEYQDRRAGSIGLVGCLSFFPSKNLGVFGDGGMVFTDDDALAEKIKILRLHGAQPKNFNKFIGGNFRLDALQAAIACVKLKHLDDWTERRRANAAHYHRRFAEAGLPEDVLRVPLVKQSRHVFNLYVIETPRRDALREHLRAQGIDSNIYFPRPFHLQECFRNLGGVVGDLPVAEKQAAENLAIPVFPELTIDGVDRVADAVIGFLAQSG